MKKIDNIAGGLGIALMVASMIWYSIGKIWGTMHTVLLILGLAGVIYFIVVYYTKREKKLSGRSLKYGSNIVFQIVAVIVIVGLLAFITTRHHVRADLTGNNLYSLSDQTEKVLQHLEKDVQILAFFKSAEQSAAKDLLDEYDYRSSHVRYRLIDPDEEPNMTKQYGIKKYNTLVVESGIKRETVEKMSESNLTNAIIKVTRDQEKVIYFLTGHGERSINDDSQEGFKKAAENIKKENYLVRSFNLVRSRSIPDSCTVLAVIGPKTNFFPGELDTIKAWVDKGNKMLLMADPEHQPDIVDFLEKFHITLGNDMVIDASGMGQLFGAGPGMPLVSQYDQKHPITKGFNIMTFYPYTSSLTPMEDKGGYTMSELLKTSGDSWAETDYASGKVSFDETQDKRGPLTIGLAVEKKADSGKSELVVFGDSDFAKNGFFKNQGNANLFLNTVNYLAEEEDMISIRPKEIDDRRLTMTQADVSALFYLVVIAIPLIVIILGVTIFLRRNREK